VKKKQAAEGKAEAMHGEFICEDKPTLSITAQSSL
jgi:hypothetical protein